MGVGQRFNDPDTQQAMAQQSGQLPAQPAIETPAQEAPAAQAAQAAPAQQEPDLSMAAPAQPAEQPAAQPEAQATPAQEPAQFKPKVEEPAPKADTMNTYIYETLAQGDAKKGEENFNTLADWCAKNMDEAELNAVNYMLKSDDKAVVRQALQMAVGKWRKAQPSPMMTGDPIPTNTPAPAPKIQPLTKDEYVAIVGTEKYNTDFEYARQIDARRQATIDQRGKGFVSPEWSASRPPIR